MSCDEIKKKSIIELFNEMEYEEKSDYSNDCGDPSKTSFHPEVHGSSEFARFLKASKESKSFDGAVDAAVKGHKTWKSLSVLQRADSLHKIWRALKEISNSLIKNKNDFLTLVDYFDFYTDMTIQTEEYEHWRPQGVVLIIPNNYSPYFILGATVPAALATGCSVIVLIPENAKYIPLLLQSVIQDLGLPEGLFSVVTQFDETDIPVSTKISKVFFCGSYLSAQKYYTKSLAQSFNFFCPNNTAALILESCDLNAAVDKIATTTWGKNSLFGVTYIVVQESVHKSFLEKLEYRIEQLIMENINSSRFKDKSMSEKINRVVSEAIKAGATVKRFTKYESAIEWSPTVVVNYQNQNTDEDLPILKVLQCRTAKEGVTLLNNCRYGLGTSVWSEVSSQALEISTMLTCPNIWINCHGVFEPGIPLQPSGISGNCCLGGSDGLIDYILFTLNDPEEKYKSNDNDWPNSDKINAFKLATSAHQAFKNWQNMSRRKHLKDIAKALEDNKELTDSSKIISSYAHLGNKFNLSEKNSTREFLIVRNKVPVGVILLIISSSTIDIRNLILEIIPPIALGNAVIVVLREDNASVKLLVENFNNYLPQNILNVVVGLHVGIQLVTDPNIQAIWIDSESTVSGKCLEAIKNHSAKSLKHIRIIPRSLIVSHHLYQKECLKNIVVWLPKVDQFP